MSESSKKIEKQAAQLSRDFEKLLIFTAQMQESLSNKLGELSKQESNVIFTLGTQGAMIMRSLADNLRLHVSTMTGIVDRLIEKGLVVRERLEEDRRIVQVSLTSTGKTAFQAESDKRQQLNSIILNALDETERQIFLELFGKVAGSLENNIT